MQCMYSVQNIFLSLSGVCFAVFFAPCRGRWGELRKVAQERVDEQRKRQVEAADEEKKDRLKEQSRLEKQEELQEKQQREHESEVQRRIRSDEEFGKSAGGCGVCDS